MRRGSSRAAPPPGHQGALDLGHAELAALARHHQVARQHQLEAAGQRVAFHRGDERLARRRDGDAAEAAARDHRLVTAHPGLEVHPGAERAARPGQHPDPQVVVGVELVGGRRQGAGGRAVERVPRLGPADGDDLDVAAPLDRYRLCHWSPPVCRRVARVRVTPDDDLAGRDPVGHAPQRGADVFEFVHFGHGGPHALGDQLGQRLPGARRLLRQPLGPRPQLEPADGDVLEQDDVERDAGNVSPGVADGHEPPAPADRPQRGLGPAVTDRVDHQVGAVAGDLLDPLLEVLAGRSRCPPRRQAPRRP